VVNVSALGYIRLQSEIRREVGIFYAIIKKRKQRYAITSISFSDNKKVELPH